MPGYYIGNKLQHDQIQAAVKIRPLTHHLPPGKTFQDSQQSLYLNLNQLMPTFFLRLNVLIISHNSPHHPIIYLFAVASQGGRVQFSLLFYLLMLATRAIGRLRRCYYSLVNKLIPFRKLRWTATCVLVATYIQIVQAVSLDIVTYLIGFYLLQLLIGYFTPKGVRDQAEDEDFNEESSSLYADSFADQFHQYNQHSSVCEPCIGLEHAVDKPLARELGEMQVWERATFAFSLGLACTYFKMVQIDVFWPLLLFYLVVLACYTIQKIFKTMDKHKYGLSDFQKGGL